MVAASGGQEEVNEQGEAAWVGRCDVATVEAEGRGEGRKRKSEEEEG